jgi:hypothetical protein
MSSPIEKSSITPCRNYKSTIADEIIEIDGSVGPIRLCVQAYELNYGPVIELIISVDDECVVGDHPFRMIDFRKICRGTINEIIDDTPAIRSLISELVRKEKFELYSTTDCTHRAALIQSLTLFWS